MQMEGDRDLALPPAEAWAKLCDAGWLVGCLTTVEVLRAEPDVAAWRRRRGLAFLAGSIDTTWTITERTAPTELKATVFSKGIGASATVATHLTFAEHEAGTRVHWQMEITQLTGLLKLIPRGLLQATAGKVVE